MNANFLNFYHLFSDVIIVKKSGLMKLSAPNFRDPPLIVVVCYTELTLHMYHTGDRSISMAPHFGNLNI